MEQFWPSENDRAAAVVLYRLFDTFAAIDPGMTMGEVAAFLTVAAGNRVTLADIERRAECTESSASRYGRALGGGKGGGKPGKELVVSWVDSKRKFFDLSPRGLLLMGQLRRIMASRSAI